MKWSGIHVKSAVGAGLLIGVSLAFGAPLLFNAVQKALSEQTLVFPQRSLVLLPQSDMDARAELAKDRERLLRSVEPVWGKEESLVSTPYWYVKYSKGYQTRTVVDFSKGRITVESLDQVNPVQSLRQSALEAVLTPAAPETDLFSDKDVSLHGEPVLYGQVMDGKMRPMRYGGRAAEFVGQVMAQGLAVREIRVNGYPRIVRSIEIPLVPNHMRERARRYLPIIQENARQFQVPARLLLSVAHVESAFNPLAVSSASAYGLMQVVPGSAGKEVHALLHGRHGQPSRSFLFDPKNNIQYGTAYLHVLGTKYFAGVTNRVSRELCMIAGYNAGPGAVLRLFGGSPEAARAAINSLDPRALYARLTREMPSKETRRYVEKVVKAMKEYKNFL